MTGTIRKEPNPKQEMIEEKFLPKIEDEEILSNKDIYTELRLRGYEYTGPFCALKSSSLKATRGHIAWMKNWAVFMDNMLQLKMLSFDTRSLYVPTGIRKMVINTKFHNEIIRHLTEENNSTLNISFIVKNIDRILLQRISTKEYRWRHSSTSDNSVLAPIYLIRIIFENKILES